MDDVLVHHPVSRYCIAMNWMIVKFDCHRHCEVATSFSFPIPWYPWLSSWCSVGDIHSSKNPLWQGHLKAADTCPLKTDVQHNLAFLTRYCQTFCQRWGWQGPSSFYLRHPGGKTFLVFDVVPLSDSLSYYIDVTEFIRLVDSRHSYQRYCSEWQERKTSRSVF